MVIQSVKCPKNDSRTSSPAPPPPNESDADYLRSVDDSDNFKLYVAGPMTGIAEFNFPAFHAAAKILREAGFSVINPAELNPDVKMTWVECMRRDIAALVTCYGVAVLPGYEKSRGAQLETYNAQKLEMPIRTVEEWIAWRLGVIM